MIARALVAILLMMNLCVAVWWATGGPPPRTHAPLPLAADAATLTLLAEAPARVTQVLPAEVGKGEPVSLAPASVVALVDVPTAADQTIPTQAAEATEAAKVTSGPQASEGSERCFSIGPFSEHDDLARVSTALTAMLLRQQVRETEISEANGYQVLLPAFPDRTAAFTAAKALQTAGIRDYYVVTAGEQQNAISLGLFRDLSNAERRRDMLRALGFDARLLPRRQQRRQWWLDIAVGTSDDWRAALSDNGSWRIEPLACR